MASYPDMGPLPVYDPEGVSGELAMWIKETHGIMLPTSNPERLKDFIQGKAIEGLARKEWQADMYTGAFWAEELVVAGLIGFKEAERLFKRTLDGELLWLYAR